MLLLNETWLKRDLSFFHRDYSIYRDDRIDGYGSNAVLIKNNIVHREITFEQELIPWGCQIQIFEFTTCNILIFNLYVYSNVRLSQDFLNSLLLFSRFPVILMGVFNSHNLCEVVYRVTKMVEFITENNLVVLNDGSQTRFKGPNYRKSVIDLTICSQCIACNSSWFLHQDPGQSKRFPTICVVNRARSEQKCRN